MFVRLQDCDRLPLDVVGAKARGLAIALRSGAPVPEGICVTSEALARTVAAAGLDGWLAERIARVEREPMTAERSLLEIRTRIRSLRSPEAVQHELRAATAQLLERGPVAVRSSAPVEDGATAAYPGVFHSAIGLATVDEVETAVNACWASAFSDRALYYGHGRPITRMAVVLQLAVRARAAGVLFTRDPLGEGGMVVELSTEGTQEVTRGRPPTARVRLDDPSSAAALGACVANELHRLATVQKEALGTDCDLEWAWDGDRMHLLQVRPITAGTTGSESATEWCDQEDTGRIFGLRLGRCADLLARQLQKKVWYRRFCRERGILTYRLAYVVFTAAGLREAREDFLREFGTSHVRVNWGGPSVLVGRDRLVDMLCAGMRHNPVPIDRACAQVGEIIPATSTGYSAVLADGQVRIEAFPAGLEGTKDSTYLPSVHVVEPTGRTTSSPTRFEAIASLTEHGDWTQRLTAPYEFALSPELVRSIAWATRQLHAEFGEVRLEWYGVDDLMVVKDLTLESRPIADAEIGVVSPGTAAGRVVRVEVEEFDRLGREFEVSVMNDEEEQLRLRGLAAVARVRGTDARPLVVADHASIGLIALVGSVAGFVFRRASLLCHTAIALREHGIPAVVSPQAFAELRDGDHALIGPTGITVLAGGRR